jgi:hypothetical protein
MSTQTPYQAIYAGRDGATHVSQRFGTADEASEYLDTVVIGAGLVIVVTDGGEIFPVQAVDSDGREHDYRAPVTREQS